MYEEQGSAVSTALAKSSAEVFTAATITKILSLTTKGTDTAVRFDDASPDASGAVTVAAGAEVVFVKSSDTVPTTITAPVKAPVVIFQGKGGVNASFNDGQTTVHSGAGVVDRIVVASAGADKLVIGDAKNTLVTIGAGDTVVAGGGNDTIIAGTGNSTVQGGTGRAIVQLQGGEDNYNVTVVNGHAVVKNTATGTTTDISKIQFVQLDGGEALIFAKDAKQAAVATMYEATFGRTADAGGLQFWFDLAKSGVTLEKIALAFTQSAEYKAQAATTDNAFVSNLYLNTFGRAADAAGMTFWTNALSKGQVDRAHMIENFASIAGQNLDGTMHTEATIVGAVTIIHNII